MGKRLIQDTNKRAAKKSRRGAKRGAVKRGTLESK